MIYSMTAFARLDRRGDWGNLVCEMRSINHRYLEIYLHLPEILRMFEMPIREQIRSVIKRGKVECNVRYQADAGSQANMLTLNEPLAQALCASSDRIAQYLKSSSQSITTDILRFPGVLETAEIDPERLQVPLEDLVGQTTNELIKVRAREGSALQQLFLGRLNLMAAELARVRERLPTLIQEQRERLYKRFTEAKLELDPNRLEQEMVMYVQKIDVAEEVDRTQTHINEMRRIIEHGGSVGRRLDFLLQELNREANTMGSKSTDTGLTHAAVEIKVLIEQIREQVQNVE